MPPYHPHMEHTDAPATEILAAHYFAGILGMSMLRRWYEDAEFNEARLAELAALLANRHEFPHSLALSPLEHELLDGYARWSASYDGHNPLIEAEEPHVHDLLTPHLGADVRALDGACGTGRHAAWLAAQGCTVDGVDQSEAMLAVAREKVPGAAFHEANLTALPFDDATFDVAVCALALCHLADPTNGIVELGRVQRPGGTLVITDPHTSSALLGGQAFFGGIVDGEPMRWVRNHYHSAATWLRAFRTAGLEVTDCREPEFTDAQTAASPSALFYPDALKAAAGDLPGLWVWALTKRA